MECNGPTRRPRYLYCTIFGSDAADANFGQAKNLKQMR